jgi:hypothetical protein
MDSQAQRGGVILQALHGTSEPSVDLSRISCGHSTSGHKAADFPPSKFYSLHLPRQFLTGPSWTKSFRLHKFAASYQIPMIVFLFKHANTHRIIACINQFFCQDVAKYQEASLMMWVNNTTEITTLRGPRSVWYILRTN